MHPADALRAVAVLVNIAFAGMLAGLLATGIRLLLAARRTRGLPELTIGVGTLTGAVGGICETASIRMLEAGGDAHTAFLIQAGARMLYMIGSAFLLVAFWRIYHATRAWARALALAGSAALLAIGVAWALGGVHGKVSGPDLRGFVLHSGRGAVYVWGVASGFWYWLQLRRRLRLGLADPVITQQVLLWAIASGSAVGISATILVYQHGLGISPLDTMAGTAWLAAFGLATGVTLYLAFFPPGFYRRWVSARAPA